MKWLKHAVWVFIILGAGLLFFSVRYSKHQFELAIAAAVTLGIGFILDHFAKKNNT